MKKKTEWYFEIYEPMLEIYVRVYKDKSMYENIVRVNSWDESYEVSEHSDWCTCPRWVFDWVKLCFIMYLEDYSVTSVFVHELYHLVWSIECEFHLWEEACAYLIWYIYREFSKYV